MLQPVNLIAQRGILAFQPPKLLIEPASAADPRIAPSVLQPARHRARTLQHDRCHQPLANAILMEPTPHHSRSCAGASSSSHRARSLSSAWLSSTSMQTIRFVTQLMGVKLAAADG